MKLVCKMFGTIPKPRINIMHHAGLAIESISYWPELFESFDESDYCIVD